MHSELWVLFKCGWVGWRRYSFGPLLHRHYVLLPNCTVEGTIFPPPPRLCARIFSRRSPSSNLSYTLSTPSKFMLLWFCKVKRLGIGYRASSWLSWFERQDWTHITFNITDSFKIIRLSYTFYLPHTESVCSIIMSTYTHRSIAYRGRKGASHLKKLIKPL